MPDLAAARVDVSELIQAAAEYEGEEVTIEGELIGDYGKRRDGSMWTQLNGDAYAVDPILEDGQPVGGNSGIAIRMPEEFAENLDPPGRYGTKGPVVRVVGVWRYHDPDRQGESYLQVDALVVIEAGRDLPQKPSWMTVIAGLCLIAGAAIRWLADLRRTRRRRRSNV
jgi:hypothetical protein